MNLFCRVAARNIFVPVHPAVLVLLLIRPQALPRPRLPLFLLGLVLGIVPVVHAF